MEHTKPSNGNIFSKKMWWVILIIGVVGFVLMFTGHRSHLLLALPYLILLACPLMHLFMHKGHGGHDHGSDKR